MLCGERQRANLLAAAYTYAYAFILQCITTLMRKLKTPSEYQSLFVLWPFIHNPSEYFSYKSEDYTAIINKFSDMLYFFNITLRSKIYAIKEN